jgi:hypothetical protein
MDNLMIAFQVIALVGFVSLAPILHSMWTTTDGIFYSLMATLLCVLCGFISIIFIYDWITYVQP